MQKMYYKQGIKNGIEQLQKLSTEIINKVQTK